jgi:CRP-like cAMP-binding protein
MATPSPHLLSDSWLTATLTPDEADQLLQLCRLRALDDGAMVFKSGEPSNEAFFVRTGSVELVEDGVPTGLPVRITRGAVLCDLSLVAPGPHTISARAVGPTRLYELSAEAFKRLRSESPAAAAKLQRELIPSLARRLRETNERIDLVMLDREGVLPTDTQGYTGHLQEMADRLLAEHAAGIGQTQANAAVSAARRPSPTFSVQAEADLHAEEPVDPASKGVRGFFKSAVKTLRRDDG